MAEPFTIYVIQSAHTDIGYTHPQEQIERMYLDAYDRVLDFCRQTAHLPEAQRFKWTCETFWQVRHYLTRRPEREEEFLSLVRAGQIEITATYLHYTDLIDPDAYRQSILLAVDYCQRHQLPLRCALHSDINGWSWAVADIFAEQHIPYFCSQIQIHCATDPLGRPGSVHYHWLRDSSWELSTAIRSDAPFRIPQAFWWQGPAGGRVLHWLGEQYLLGNVLGLSGVKAFHADKTRYFTETDHTTVDELYAIAHQEVPRYVERLRAAGYPYQIALISTGGFCIDNSPPDRRWCELIGHWNAEQKDIQLRTAVVGEWFEALQQQQEFRPPTYAVAWPDYWAHGLGSCTARIAQARRSQRRRADISALVSLVDSPAASSFLDMALEQERFSLEHTFGAWSTTEHPDSSLNAFQQNVKEQYFHRAEHYFDEAAGTALRALSSTEPGPRLYTGSPLRREGLRSVHFTAADLALHPANQSLSDRDGRVYAFQQEGQKPAQFVAVLPIKQGELSSFHLLDTPAPGRHGHRGGFAITQEGPLVHVETAAWHMSIDTIYGGLHRLRECATGHEWVDPHHQYGFGQLVHEFVVHPRGREAIGNSMRFIATGVATDPFVERWPAVPVFERFSVTMTEDLLTTTGQVFDEITLGGTSAQSGRVQVSWRCYHGLPFIELVIDWEKSWSDLPEAAYVAFPFAAPSGELALETGGAFFQPGSHEAGGQLPGTCSNYYTIQRAAQILTLDGAKGFWLPLDVPLVMTNEIDFNHWETESWKWNGFLASMPVNNYWFTNFPANQRGHLRLRYRFLSERGFASAEQAIEAAQPVEALGWR